jgi:hypothetical protein
MTSASFQGDNVADAGAPASVVDPAASLGPVAADDRATSPAVAASNQELPATPNLSPAATAASAHERDQPDPIALVRGGGESADGLGSIDAGLRRQEAETSHEPFVVSEAADSAQSVGSQSARASDPVRVCRKCSAQSQVSGDFCPRCGASFTGGRVRRKAKAAAARTPSASARSVAPDQQSRGMIRIQQVVLVIVGVLAVVGVGLGLFALTNQPSTAPLQRQINALKAVDASQHQQIASLRTQTATLKAATASAATAGNLTALQTSVGGLSKSMQGVQGDLSALHNCLPELDQEVGALNVNTSTGSVLLGDGTTDTFLTDAYINNPTVISNNCNKFLTGQ